jgi:IS5 family transposase
MLTLVGAQVESLWDEVLPREVRELPEDLARLDRVLGDGVLLAPIAGAWRLSARDRGRPTIAMSTFVRLMVVKARTGWGYETLVREISDSLHLRRFCLIAIDQRVPDESTVRKLARRLGSEAVEEITRLVIEKAKRETRFWGRAVRVDSTVVEADIRYPSDAMLALQGVRALARESKKLTAREAHGADQRQSGARQRPLTLGREDGPGDLEDTRAPHRRGEGTGDGAQRAGGPVDSALGARGTVPRDPGPDPGARARRADEASRRSQARRARSALPQGRRADRPQGAGTEDHRPSRLDQRSGVEEADEVATAVHRHAQVEV